jgi:hypothetical protein
MPGVGGQSWSLASIRSNDVDLGRASGGGPPGADGNMGDVLSGTDGPPATADKVDSAAPSCAIAWSSEIDLGSERLRGPAGTVDGKMGDVLSGSERLRGPAGTVSLRLGSTESPDVLAGAWALGSAALADWSRAIAAVA